MEQKLVNRLSEINNICNSTIYTVQKIKEFIKSSTEHIKKNDDLDIFTQIAIKITPIYNMLLKVDSTFQEIDVIGLPNVSTILSQTIKSSDEKAWYDTESDREFTNNASQSCIINNLSQSDNVTNKLVNKDIETNDSGNSLKTNLSLSKIQTKPSLSVSAESEKKSKCLYEMRSKKVRKRNKQASENKVNAHSITNLIIKNNKNISTSFTKGKGNINKASTDDVLKVESQHSQVSNSNEKSDTKISEDCQITDVCMKFLPERMLLENEFGCTISYFNTPLSFYIVPKTYFATQRIIENQLKLFYNDKDKSFEQKKGFGKNNYYAIHITKEKIWCRATINTILKNETVEMFCIDFGLMIIVKQSSIFPLDAQFFEYPPLAYECYLESVDLPANGKWSSEMIEFGNMCVSFLFLATIHSNCNDKLGVELRLLNDFMTLNLRYCERNLDLIRVDDNLIFKPDENDDKFMTADMKILIGGEDYNDEELLCKNYIGPPHTTCYKGDKCKKMHELPNPDGWTKQQIKTAKLQPVNLPSVGAYLEMKPTVVLSYSSFYSEFKIRNQRSESHLNYSIDELKEEMNRPDAVKSYNMLKYPPDNGEFVLAKHSQKNFWCRGIVLPKLDKHFEEIFFVDFGDKDKVLLENLRMVPEWLACYPPRVVLCNLSGVQLVDDRRSEEAKQTLQKMILGKTVIGIVVYASPVNDMLELNVTRLDGYSYAKMLKEEGLVTIKEIKDTKTESTSKYIPV